MLTFIFLDIGMAHGEKWRLLTSTPNTRKIILPKPKLWLGFFLHSVRMGAPFILRPMGGRGLQWNGFVLRFSWLRGRFGESRTRARHHHTGRWDVSPTRPITASFILPAMVTRAMVCWICLWWTAWTAKQSLKILANPWTAKPMISGFIFSDPTVGSSPVTAKVAGRWWYLHVCQWRPEFARGELRALQGCLYI